MRRSQVRYHIVAGVSVSPGGAIDLDNWETVGKAVTLEQAWGIASTHDDPRDLAIIPVKTYEEASEQTQNRFDGTRQVVEYGIGKSTVSGLHRQRNIQH